jgi:hypothetical protein
MITAWSLIMSMGMLVLLWPNPALANIGLPMVALYLPPAWLALVPIILIEGAYGVWRFKIPPGRALLAQAVANCLSTLIGLPVVWIALALGQLFVFKHFPNLTAALPAGVALILSSAWLSPGVEETVWIVPVAVAALTLPFYVMSWSLSAWLSGASFKIPLARSFALGSSAQTRSATPSWSCSFLLPGGPREWRTRCLT